MYVEAGRTNKLAGALVALTVTLVAPPTRAQSPTAKIPESAQTVSPVPQDILSAVPAEASGVLIIRDLAGFDAKLRQLTGQLGVPFSPYMLAKGWLQVVSGIDEHGAAAIFVIPSDTPDQLSPRVAMLLPTVAHKQILSFLSPQQLDDGLTKVILRGRESYVGTMDSYTVFASDLRTVKGIISAKKNLADRFSDHQRERVAANEVSLWIDLSSSTTRMMPGLAAPWLRPLLGGEGSGPRMFRSIQLSARIEPEGIAFELYGERNNARRGGAVREVTGTMLRGLPDEPFVLALGTTGGVFTANARTIVALYVSTLSATGILDTARSGELTLALEPLIIDTKDAAASLSIMPEGSDGMIAIAKVVRTTGDAQALPAKIDTLTRVLKRGLFVNPDVNSALTKLEYRRGVETSLGVSVDHIVLDLSGFESVNKDAITAVLGREGLLVRIGVVDHKDVVLTVGGGLERFNKIVTSVRSGQAPLASDPGTLMSALGVARRRWLEAYLSVDRGIGLVHAISAAMGIPASQPEIPETNAPIALAIHSVGPNATQADFFIPTELLVAIKDLLIGQAASEVTLGP